MEVNDENELFGGTSEDIVDAGNEQDGNPTTPKDGGEGEGTATDGDPKESGDGAGEGGEGGESGDTKDTNKEGATNEGTDKDPEGGEAGTDKDKDKDDKVVPKKALDSEKRRRRELAARLKKLEEREAERERAAAAAAAPRLGDPDYEKYVQQQAIVASVNERLNRSEYDTRKEHGDELVDDMMAWAQERFPSDPAWAQQVLSHPHPYDFAMKAYKEHQEAEEKTSSTTDDPDFAAFIAWRNSQGGGGQQPPANQQPQQPPKKAPPISLAQREAAGSAAPTKPAKDPFDAEFG